MEARQTVNELARGFRDSVSEAVSDEAEQEWERYNKVKQLYLRYIANKYKLGGSEFTLAVSSENRELLKLRGEELGISSQTVEFNSHPKDAPRKFVETLQDSGLVDVGELEADVASFIRSLDDVRSSATLDDAIRAVEDGDWVMLDILFDTDSSVRNLSAEENAIGSLWAELDTIEIAKINSTKALAIPQDEEEEEPEETVWNPPRRNPSRNETVERKEGYVIGTDDTPTGFYVHPIDVTGRNDPTKFSTRDVRRQMGYKYESKERLKDVKGNFVRIQGDLRGKCIAQFEVDNDLYTHDSYVPRGVDEVEGDDRTNDPETVAKQSMLMGRALSNRNNFCGTEDRRHGWYALWNMTEFDYLPTEIEEHGVFFYNFIKGNVYTRLSQKWTEFPDTRGGTVPRDITRQGLVGYEALRTRFEREFKSMAYDYLQPCEQLAQSVTFGKTNLQLDNHLLRFDNAAIYPASNPSVVPVVVVIPEESEVTIYHDEHDTVTKKLNPGAYEFSFLRRGVAVFYEELASNSRSKKS